MELEEKFKEGLKKLNEKKILESLLIFQDLQESNPNNIDIQFCLGNIYYELNDLNKSLKYLKKSYEYYSNSQAVINNYAIALQTIGKINEAERLFNKLIQLKPNDLKAYYRLFRIGYKKFDNNYYEKIKYFEKNENLNLQDKSFINFIISKYEKKKNNIENEVKYLNLSHQYQFKYNQEYNYKSVNFYNNLLFNFYNKFNFTNTDQKLFKQKKIKPIFIIGLPRSGSTLIESLLSNDNKKLYTYGETSIFDIGIKDQLNVSNLSIKKKFEINESSLLNRVNNIYNYKQNKNFIDKSLENFFYIDVILKLFPKAKFIHTFRNKFDAIIGIYQSMLIYQPWTHSIDNIIKYINNYENIISYFKNKYPDKILEIDLEKFTLSPIVYSKKIYNFCNLEWDENILKFYKKKNLTSKSSSFLQIRNGITKYDNKKYRPYYYLFKKKI